MRNTGTDAEHQVHALTQSGGVREVLQLGAELQNVWMGLERATVGFRELLLQTDVLEALGQAANQNLQGNTTVTVMRIEWIARPGKTDARRPLLP